MRSVRSGLRMKSAPPLATSGCASWKPRRRRARGRLTARLFTGYADLMPIGGQSRSEVSLYTLLGDGPAAIHGGTEVLGVVYLYYGPLRGQIGRSGRFFTKSQQLPKGDS